MIRVTLRQVITVLVVAAGVLAGAAAVASASSPAPGRVLEAGSIAALARDGFEFREDPAGLAVVAAAMPDQSFADQAAAMFGTAPTATVHRGRLTVHGRHQGDETTPLAISGRDVVAVSLSGLDMRPMGARSTAPSHSELVVFFDAASGDFLVATTSR